MLVTSNGLVRFKYIACFVSKYPPASVAQLDACQTGAQEVEGSTPARSAIFFRGD